MSDRSCRHTQLCENFQRTENICTESTNLWTESTNLWTESTYLWNVFKYLMFYRKKGMHKCQYCEKTFTDKSNVTRHEKNSVRCINARGLKSATTSASKFACDCGYSISRKDAFIRHQSGCVCVKMVAIIEDQMKTIDNHVKTIEDRDKTIATDSKTIAKLEEQVKLLMTRPINVNNHTTNNNGPTYNMSYYKQHIQDNFESITQPLLQGVMNQITLDDISYGGSGLAKFVKKHLDHQHLLMLDQARRKGAYKDAKGQVVVDAKLRTLLQMIGEAAYPPAKKIFIDWNAANPDGFLDTGKCKILTSLLGATGWLNRVGDGKTDEDDSEILSSFVDELASGYTKEALHNHLDQQAAPPLIDTDDDDPEAEVHEVETLIVERSSEGFESDVSSDWPEIEEEPDSDEEDYETDIESVSMTSSQFDVVIGMKNYEVCRVRGTRDEDNLYENFKGESKYAITN
jgi:hypothetical protein